MTVHSFSRPWTMIKLELLKRYLELFSTALHCQPSPGQQVKRIYIDALADTGECDLKLDEGLRSPIAGSAEIELEALPTCDRIHPWISIQNSSPNYMA